jgi:hypothetical protein
MKNFYSFLKAFSLVIGIILRTILKITYKLDRKEWEV